MSVVDTSSDNARRRARWATSERILKTSGPLSGCVTLGARPSTDTAAMSAPAKCKACGTTLAELALSASSRPVVASFTPALALNRSLNSALPAGPPSSSVGDSVSSPADPALAVGEPALASLVLVDLLVGVCGSVAGWPTGSENRTLRPSWRDPEGVPSDRCFFLAGVNTSLAGEELVPEDVGAPLAAAHRASACDCVSWGDCDPSLLRLELGWGSSGFIFGSECASRAFKMKASTSK